MTGQPARPRRPAEDSTDRELLHRFVAAREERAFAVLVQRHAAGVLGVCQRVLGNHHDAEDVCQATFLTLARKAAVIPWQESVRHWLQAVAQRLAMRARCSAQRRRQTLLPGPGADWPGPLERPDPHGDPLAEVARRELRFVLNEELDQLPEKYRAPMVLCYLEGKTNEQAAGELGWPTGSMSRRLARARALLHDRLSRRGLALAIALGVLVLITFWLVPAGPPTLHPRVAHTMTVFRPAGEGGEGIEMALHRLADGGAWPGEAERARLVQMAYRTGQVADVVHSLAPDRRRRDWRLLASEMRTSALDLAEALAHNDEQATRTTARRLTGTCQTCHATFRD
jgi:RNA polymerase sigma-70 factor (ECF subfamily)